MKVSNSPVSVIEKSDNSKVGNCSATYVSQASCPSRCPFLPKITVDPITGLKVTVGQGCYANLSFAGMHTNNLNRNSVTDVDVIAKLEAEGIVEKLSGKRHLRLHVVGDTTTNTGAKLLSEASDIYMSRYNKKVWTYTHGHSTSRESWGNISVLRSCETIKEIEQSDNEGFACAMVVEEFKQHSAYDIGNGFKGLPCPEQSKGKTTCADCKLCMNDKHLRKNKIVILFEAHGAQKGKVKEALQLKML